MAAKGDKNSQGPPMDEDAMYDAKLKEVQRYIPFVEDTIRKIENKTFHAKDAMLSKLKSLRSLLCHSERMKMANLVKCEEICKKIHAQVTKQLEKNKKSDKVDIVNIDDNDVVEKDEYASKQNKISFNFYKEYMPEASSSKTDSYDDLNTENTSFETCRMKLREVTKATMQSEIKTTGENRVINLLEKSCKDSIMAMISDKLQSSVEKRLNSGNEQQTLHIEKKHSKSKSSKSRHSKSPNEFKSKDKNINEKEIYGESLDSLLKYRKQLKKELKRVEAPTQSIDLTLSAETSSLKIDTAKQIDRLNTLEPEEGEIAEEINKKNTTKKHRKASLDDTISPKGALVQHQVESSVSHLGNEDQLSKEIHNKDKVNNSKKIEQDVIKALKAIESDINYSNLVRKISTETEVPASSKITINSNECSNKSRKISLEKYKEKSKSDDRNFNESSKKLRDMLSASSKEVEQPDFELKEAIVDRNIKKCVSMAPDSPDPTDEIQYEKNNLSPLPNSKTNDIMSIYSDAESCHSFKEANNEYLNSPNVNCNFQQVDIRHDGSSQIPSMLKNMPSTQVNDVNNVNFPRTADRFNFNYSLSSNYMEKNPKHQMGGNYTYEGGVNNKDIDRISMARSIRCPYNRLNDVNPGSFSNEIIDNNNFMHPNPSMSSNTSPNTIMNHSVAKSESSKELNLHKNANHLSQIKNLHVNDFNKASPFQTSGSPFLAQSQRNNLRPTSNSNYSNNILNVNQCPPIINPNLCRPDNIFFGNQSFGANTNDKMNFYFNQHLINISRHRNPAEIKDPRLRRYLNLPNQSSIDTTNSANKDKDFGNTTPSKTIDNIATNRNSEVKINSIETPQLLSAQSSSDSMQPEIMNDQKKNQNCEIKDKQENVSCNEQRKNVPCNKSEKISTHSESFDSQITNEAKADKEKATFCKEINVESNTEIKKSLTTKTDNLENDLSNSTVNDEPDSIENVENSSKNESETGNNDSKDILDSVVDVLTDKKKILDVITILNQKGEKLPAKIQKKLKLLADLESDEEFDNEEVADTRHMLSKKDILSSNSKTEEQTEENIENSSIESVHPEKKRKCRKSNELALLRSSLPEMFMTQGELTHTGIRMCRLVKELNYDGNNENSKKNTKITDLNKVCSNNDTVEKNTNEKLPIQNVIQNESPNAKINMKIDSTCSSETASSGNSKEVVPNELDVPKLNTSLNTNENIDSEVFEKYKIKPGPKSKKILMLQKLKESSDSNDQPKRKRGRRRQKARTISESESSTSTMQNAFEHKEIPSKNKICKAKRKGKFKNFKKQKRISYYYKSYRFNEAEDYEYECKYCDDFKGSKIVEHYVQCHPHKDVLISRLSIPEAKLAISESLAMAKKGVPWDHYPTSNFSDYQCRFCLKKFVNCHISVFGEHLIRTHTGEYEHECNICSSNEFNGKSVCLQKQYMSNIDPSVYVLKGFICEKCNFTQLFKKHLLEHVEEQHSSVRCKIYEINLSKITTSSYQNRTVELLDLPALVSTPDPHFKTHSPAGNKALPVTIKKEMNDEENIDDIIPPNFEIDSDLNVKDEETTGIFSLTEDMFDFTSDLDPEKSIKELNIKSEPIEQCDEFSESLIRHVKTEPNFDDNIEIENPLQSDDNENRTKEFSIDNLHVIQDSNGANKFLCKMGSCNLSTQYLYIFAEHFEIVHAKDTWNGFCNECDKIVSTEEQTYSTALYHIIRSHLKFSLDEPFDNKENDDNVRINNATTEPVFDCNINPSTELTFPVISNVVSLGEFDDSNNQVEKYGEIGIMNIKQEKNVDEFQPVTNLSKEKNHDGLFICGGSDCNISTNDMSVFIEHYNHHLKIKDENSNSKWKECVYCEMTPPRGLHLWHHIINEHGHCTYKCNECLFRSSSYLVSFAHSFSHSATNNTSSFVLIKAYPGSNIDNSVSSILEKSDCFSHYVCTVGENNDTLQRNTNEKSKNICNKKFYSSSKFSKHYLTYHIQKMNKLRCYHCNSEELNFASFMSHMRLQHNFHEYKCAYCTTGADDIHSLLLHFASDHSNKIPVVYSTEEKDEEDDDVIMLDLEENSSKHISEIFNINIDQNQIKTLNIYQDSIYFKIAVKKAKKKQLVEQNDKNVDKIIEIDDNEDISTNNIHKNLYSESKTKLQESINNSCNICNANFSTPSACEAHMKSLHGYFETSTNNVNQMPNETPKKHSRPKHSIVSPDVKLNRKTMNSKKLKNTFDPSDINNLPHLPILSENIYCSICSFNTKVTSNMQRHLQMHASEVTVPNAAPVNPVPHLQSNEMHFDKMTNLALSSHIDQVKKQVKKSKKIPEKGIPQFVPNKDRYVCGALNCAYVSLNEEMLKHHWETLHRDEKVYNCIHCKASVLLKGKSSTPIFNHLKLHDVTLYRCTQCNYVHNLACIIKKHCLRYHGKDKVSLERGPIADKSMLKYVWECGICNNKYSFRKLLAAHCIDVHEIPHPYKCNVCSFSAETSETVYMHCKNVHQNVIGGVLKVYMKVKDDQKLDAGNSTANLQATNVVEAIDNKKPIWWERRKRGSRFGEEDSIEGNHSNVRKKIKIATDQTSDSPNEKRGFERIQNTSTSLLTCPVCCKFTTNSSHGMRSHLCEELNYRQWECGICQYKSFDAEKITTHANKEHRREAAVIELPPIAEKESWIDSLLSQSFKQDITSSQYSNSGSMSELPKSNTKVTNDNDSNTDDDVDMLVICEKEDIIQKARPYQIQNQSNSHVCIKCTTQMNKAAIETHKTKCHPKSHSKLILERTSTVFSCTICFKLTSDKFSLQRHFASNHPNSNFNFTQCTLGDLDIFKSKSVGSDSKKMQDENLHLQKDSVYEFSDSSFAIDECNFQCGYCALSFNKYCGLRRHHGSKHRDDIILVNPINRADIKSTGELKNPIGSFKHSLFPCIVSGCHEIFHTFPQFENHVKKHYLIVQDFVCSTCFNHFDSSISLVDHCKNVHNHNSLTNNSDSAVIARIYQIDYLLTSIKSKLFSK